MAAKFSSTEMSSLMMSQTVTKQAAEKLDVQVDACLLQCAVQQVIHRRAYGDHGHIAKLFENTLHADARAEL